MTNRRQKPQSKSRNLLTMSIIFILGWFTYDRLNVLMTYQSEQATILNCDNSWTKRRVSNTSARDEVISAPVAMADSGQSATSKLKFPEEICDRMMGSATIIYVHPNDPERNRIGGFTNFWLIPGFFAYLTFMMLFFTGRPRTGFMVTLITIGLSGYFIVTETNYANMGKKPEDINSALSASEKALNNCIKRDMLKYHLQARFELKRVLCQDQNITDLSSLADMSDLEELYLQGNALTSLETLPVFSKLKKLSVAGNKTLNTLAGIENAPNLEELQGNKSAIADINHISSLYELKIIGLMMNNINDLNAVEELNKLEDVTFSYNQIENIEALANKPALRELSLYSNKVIDITPLMNNKAMKVVGLRGDESISCADIRALKTILASDAKVYGPEKCDAPN